MRIAMLAPIAWSTPPAHYGPWEQVVSLLTEQLVAKGVDVTLFASGDSRTAARLQSVVARGYEEDPELDIKVWEALHISNLFDQADEFDLIHNHFDFLPLSYAGLVETPVVSTIHGFSSPSILPVYEKYNHRVAYVAISDADRASSLDYVATIHHGIDLDQFTFQAEAGNYLLFFGRIHPDKGVVEAIEVAQAAGKKLIMAGVIHDQVYFDSQVQPHIDGDKVQYLGSVGPDQRDRLLGGALALLHPINFAEPFGLSVIEAMACGTPVVACNRGSMPELITDGENGFLVDNAQAMAGVLSRIGDIDRRTCRATVEQRFTAERMAEAYIAAYRQVLEQHKRIDHRPWGHYVVLADEPQHKVKRIIVKPGMRLSLQRHQRRAEHWYVIEGEALVTRNQERLPLKPGEAVDIPRGAVHRVENPGPEDMAFIEVQTGDYFGEDDIERLEDDFGRS